MDEISLISIEVLDELKTSLANGYIKKKYSVAQIVEHEMFFWETRIKVWCSSNDEYLALWMDFLGRCGFGAVSSSYLEKLFTATAKKLKLKRTTNGFRRVNYE